MAAAATAWAKGGGWWAAGLPGNSSSGGLGGGWGAAGPGLAATAVGLPGNSSSGGLGGGWGAVGPGLSATAAGLPGNSSSGGLGGGWGAAGPGLAATAVGLPGNSSSGGLGGGWGAVGPGLSATAAGLPGNSSSGGLGGGWGAAGPGLAATAVGLPGNSSSGGLGGGWGAVGPGLSATAAGLPGNSSSGGLGGGWGAVGPGLSATAAGLPGNSSSGGLGGTGRRAAGPVVAAGGPPGSSSSGGRGGGRRAAGPGVAATAGGPPGSSSSGRGRKGGRAAAAAPSPAAAAGNRGGDGAAGPSAAAGGSGTGQGGPEVLQRFRLTFITPWCKEMLQLYGKSVVLMDATYGLDVYQYPLVVLMVVDHWGNGIPIAFGIIASHEAGDDVAGVITDVEEMTGFRIPNFIIDKSKGEIERQYAARAAQFQLGRLDQAGQRHRRLVALLEERAAETMRVVNDASGTIAVASLKPGGMGHLVCLADGTCTCKAGSVGGVCVQLEAAYRARGGGADGARRRAEQLGLTLSMSRKPLVARQAVDVTVYRSMTTEFFDAGKAALPGAAPERPRRRKAVVDKTTAVPACSCSLFDTHGQCAHAIAVEVSRQDGAPRALPQATGVDFSRVLCSELPSPVGRGPGAPAVAKAALLGREESVKLRGLSTPPSLYPGATAMRAGGAALNPAQGALGDLQQLQRLLSSNGLPPDALLAVRAHLRSALEVAQAAVAAAAPTAIGDAPPSPQSGGSGDEQLVVTPPSRQPRSTDRRTPKQRIGPTLYDPRRRQKGQRADTGAASADEETADEETADEEMANEEMAVGMGEEEAGTEEAELGEEELRRIKAKSRPRTKGGLRE
ncbi:hypothetical protein PLESTM_000944100 [Pleodorina starrii]|nr:hypothetical protein PLESTM_000944100 [Pleodorina starrii]